MLGVKTLLAPTCHPHRPHEVHQQGGQHRHHQRRAPQASHQHPAHTTHTRQGQAKQQNRVAPHAQVLMAVCEWEGGMGAWVREGEG